MTLQSGERFLLQSTRQVPLLSDTSAPIPLDDDESVGLMLPRSLETDLRSALDAVGFCGGIFAGVVRLLTRVM